MGNETVQIGAMIGMVFAMIISIGTPIALLVFCLKKSKAKLSSFFIGCGIFFLFALVLEGLVNFGVSQAAGESLSGNPWLFALYGAFAAAFFEEVGRGIAMKFFMKKNLDLPNAVVYGVGHGGIESILLVGLASVSNLINAVMINNGTIRQAISVATPEDAEIMANTVRLYLETPALNYYLGGLERVFALILQIAMSIIMFQAVKHHKLKYYGTAFLAHFVTDFVTVLASQFHVATILIEVLVLIMAVFWMLVAFAISGKEKI